ncbi:hypothetical protein FJY71_04570, partial [candidate division WOR-3 bacterium]|nr:hypothetical protein [candidate division WOR-3 bacterium]
MWYRVVSVLFVGCILIRPAAAQQLDTVIHFPDSLGYCYMPTAVLANPLTGRVYVPNGGDVGGVLVFDPATRTKERFLRGYYHDGIYCPNVGKLYLAGESELAVLDATTDSLLRVIPLEYEIGGLVSSPTSGKLYVLPPEDGGEWVVLDAAGDTVLAVLEEVSVATSPVWDTVANRICAVGEDDGVIGILDCFGDTVVAELVVGGGHGLYGLALDPESRRLYCSSETDTMFVADVDSLRFVGAIGGVLVSGPLLYNPVLDRVYGPNYDAMVVVDCRSGSVRRRLTVGYINELALNPVSGRVYVSLYNPPGVVVLDAGDTVAAAIGTADIGTPQALGCAAARSELYCAMQMDNVAVVDCRADTLSGVMDYAQYIIRGIVHGSVGDRLYLLFPDRGLVTALDREYRQVSTLAVPMVDANVFPVYNPGLNRLYIADSARLWVID